VPRTLTPEPLILRLPQSRLSPGAALRALHGPQACQRTRERRFSTGDVYGRTALSQISPRSLHRCLGARDVNFLRPLRRVSEDDYAVRPYLHEAAPRRR
jgi:hypothetical protein